MKPLLVFPLAGLGVRFTEQGITTPKQLLKVDADISCLEKTILSIKNINDFNIISYVRDPQVYEHLESILKKLNTNYHLIKGEGTKSPIETIYRILDSGHSFIDDEVDVYVHTLDIDVPDNFHLNTDYPISTYTFKANSTNYSYVEVTGEHVINIAPQNTVGEFANAGIYGFGKVGLLMSYCIKSLELSNLISGEIPLVDIYKLYIADKIKIKAILLSGIYIFGTPSEFSFCKKFIYSKNGLKKCYLFSDHSGIPTRKKIKEILDNKGFITEDLGTFDMDNDSDYPDFAIKAHESSIKEHGYIFSSCSTGQGVNMILNKFPNTLSALVYSEYAMRMSIEHNCANAFSFPNSIWEGKSLNFITKEITNTLFRGGRHQNRLIKLLEYDGK